MVRQQDRVFRTVTLQAARHGSTRARAEERCEVRVRASAGPLLLQICGLLGLGYRCSHGTDERCAALNRLPVLRKAKTKQRRADRPVAPVGAPCELRQPKADA